MKKHITSFYIETLVLILVFVVVILTLTRVFGMAKKQSEGAKLLSNAVTLAQNAAEAFSAADSAEALRILLDEGGNADLEGRTVTVSYDTDMGPDPDGLLRVEIERRTEFEWTAEGSIRVIRKDTGDELYSIRTARTAAHLPEGFGK